MWTVKMLDGITHDVLAEVQAEGGEFGVKNAAANDWYNSQKHRAGAGERRAAAPGDIVAEPAYYVAGTCGCGGYVPDECWYGADGMDNITVDPGAFIILPASVSEACRNFSTSSTALSAQRPATPTAQPNRRAAATYAIQAVTPKQSTSVTTRQKSDCPSSRIIIHGH